MGARMMNSILLESPKIGLQGFFTVELIASKTGEVLKRLEFPNLIMDGGLAAIPTGETLAGMTTWFGVGTGTAAPSVSDTDLDTPMMHMVGSTPTPDRTNNSGGFTDVTGFNASPEYFYHRRTRTFLESIGNGALTEIGLYRTNFGGVMFARQLFRDSGGNPVVITKTNQEQLRVTYELRVIPPQSDVTGTFSVRSVTYDYTIRVAALAQWGQVYGNFIGGDGQAITEDNTLEARTDGFTPTPTSVSSQDIVPVTATSRDTVAKYEPPTAVFSTGIGGCAFCALTSTGFNVTFGLRAVWSPKIPKTTLQRLTLTTRVTWGRV